jgi:hypothetical protein
MPKECNRFLAEPDEKPFFFQVISHWVLATGGLARIRYHNLKKVLAQLDNL